MPGRTDRRRISNEPLPDPLCCRRLASSPTSITILRYRFNWYRRHSLVNDPTIIMGDEPTGNLDKANTENVFEIFRDLAGKGQTIIAVTHDPDFAAGTDRVIEMSDGMIIASHENKVQ